MDNKKKIRDIRFSEMTVGDVKHILNTVGKYSMMVFILNCGVGALASVGLLISELSTHWLSEDMDGTQMNRYIVAGTFVFSTLLYLGLSYAS